MGSCPVEEFLDSLTAKQAQKVLWVLKLIEELDRVPALYLKKLSGSDDIWEVRIDCSSDTFRILGFFEKNNIVILVNGFGKKSQKTPSKEIEKAEQMKKEWLGRRKK